MSVQSSSLSSQPVFMHSSVATDVDKIEKQNNNLANEEENGIVASPVARVVNE